MSVRRMGLGIVAAILAMAPASAQAAPMAGLGFVETALGGGAYRYDYTLSNQADPVADAGYDLFEIWLFFSTGSVTGVSVPDDWDEINGAGFLLAFSLAPGVPPLGADVAPGTSLAGFSVTFDQQVGSVPFEALFVDPLDPFNPFVFTGVTRASADSGAPVPEPAALLLLGSALGVWTAVRRRSFARSPT